MTDLATSSVKTNSENANNSDNVQLSTLEPGKLWVISRDGNEVRPFDADRVARAIKAAFIAAESKDDNTARSAQQSDRIQAMTAKLAEEVINAFNDRNPSGGTVHVEDIQDKVELTLMRTGEAEAAKKYIFYREERRKARTESVTVANISQPQAPALNITLASGERVPLDEARFQKNVIFACQDLENVDPQIIIDDARRNLFDGVPEAEVDKALTLTARTLIEKEPNYTYVTARLLLNQLRTESLRFLDVADSANFEEMKGLTKPYFRAYLERGIELKLLSPALLDYDIDKICGAMNFDRDLQFTYLSLQTLYDRYFLHSDQNRIELPQAFFMRVALGLAQEEENKTERAIEFYNMLSKFDCMSSTPTLFNSGTLRQQLSSCFLTTIPDDLNEIYSAIRDNALLSKFAGGLGNDWTPVRAMGAHIKGTNGQSQGVVPFMNVADASAVAVNQGGKRKGAVCGYLETWHMDIEEFLELRKNTGDDRRRTHDMNTANWIPDLFMKRVSEGAQWTLFSPDETPDLHDLCGEEFDKAYLAYEEMAAKGELNTTKTIPAVNLWRKMLGMIFETGHPWITFKDPCNIRSPQQHVGTVHSSNLCTEITLNTSKDEIAVCNLASVNLPAHIKADGTIDQEKLRKTVHTAIRMLDNVIDINYYTVPQAKNSNMKHRPIGLGLMGFQDALYKRKISYCSDAAVVFADRTMELISYYAIEASSNLAEERGAYKTFSGSLWSRGILPIDSIALLKESRGEYLDQDTSQTLDWNSLRERVKSVGMRNSNTLAIAPTATISNICGVSQSIEPTYQNLYVKSNMSGEFTVTNAYLVDELKALDLWDDVMIHDLKYYNGSIQNIERIPEDLKQRFSTAFEVEPSWLVEAGSRRQKWIDQSQSLNLYMAKPSGKKLDELYRLAWKRGLKTTYYLRSLGATNTEKSTIHDKALNAVQAAPVPQACSIDDPDCEACQ